MTMVIIDDKNNHMDMIWHHDKFIQLDIRKMIWQIEPDFFHNFAENICFVLGAYRHKIRTGRGIIVSLQSYRTPVVFERIVFHMKKLIAPKNKTRK